MLTMQQKERYFKATKTKQYKNPITKEDIKIEVGEVVPLSFINNKLNITTSSATVLRIQNNFEEVHNDNKNEVKSVEELSEKEPALKIEDADKKNTKNK
jgi:hypothetical protein